MDKIYFHCLDYPINIQNIKSLHVNLNENYTKYITCMNELKDILNNNLITWIHHDCVLRSCKRFSIKLAMLDCSNCEFNVTTMVIIMLFIIIP